MSIEYAPAVLDEIRRLAVGGLNLFGHGGLEVGGVLYGTCEGSRITIVSFAELPCEHALGPGFVLSPSDREKLDALLTAPDGLEPIGWFRSHTRSGLNLDGHDCEMFDRAFGGKRSLGLTVKPTMRGPAAAAFFVRERSGEIRPMAARDFPLEPVPEAAEISPEPAAASDAIPSEPVPAGSPELSREPEAPAKVELAPSIAAAARPRRRLRAIWVAAAALAAVLLFAAANYWPRPPGKLALKAYAIAPGQMRIEWDHGSAPVLESRMGVLRIADGDSGETVLLDPSQLRSSSITYAQHTGRVSVRLRVERRRGGDIAEEAIEFVGAPAAIQAAVPRPEPVAPAPAAPRQAADVEVSVIPLPPMTEASRAQVEPERRAAPTRVLRVEGPTLAQHAPPITVPAAPTLTAPSPEPTAPQWLAAALPHPKPPVVKPEAPVYSGPRSGRLIWTGVLGRRGVVEIEGSQVNAGTLSGALPGVPVSLRASPAEFSRDGLTVYTPDSARSEKPSRANGWNSVQFQFDPARWGELVILESPNRANDFKRLVLRSDARSCPVIVIDWSVQR